MERQVLIDDLQRREAEKTSRAWRRDGLGGGSVGAASQHMHAL